MTRFGTDGDKGGLVSPKDEPVPGAPAEARRVTGRVQAIERCIDVLAALSTGPRNLTEVARQTTLSKATVFRLLASLGYRHLVIKDAATNQYLLGPGCLELLEGVMSGLGAIGNAAGLILARLAKETGETVTIHVRLGGQRVCIAEVPSPQPIHYTAGVGATAPLYVGAAGKILLAAMGDEERKKALRSLRLDEVTDRTLTNQEALIAELAEVREQGWALSFGERVAGASALSVPTRAGDLSAALSILGPDNRLTEDRLRTLVPVVRSAAARAEEAMIGYYVPSAAAAP